MTRIERDGTMQRRRVDTAQRGDGPTGKPRYPRPGRLAALHPGPANPVYHVRVDHHVILAAEHNLTGPLQLLDLVTAVLAMGDVVLARPQGPSPIVSPSPPNDGGNPLSHGASRPPHRHRTRHLPPSPRPLT
jgi:hypothetical protein